ncbi:MAG: adenylate/guanylate cyclase domain-containing protein [Ilumatobacteraceae bacterium]
MQTTPETRFAKSGGLSIAYQVVGSGPVDLVFVPGFMSHVELNWEYSFMGSLFESLSEFARLIILDKRGTGLSDRSLGLGTFEERMDDVRAVMDSAGIERAALCGMSEGGALCALMAATYPERVSALILYAAACPGIDVVDDATKDFVQNFVESQWTTGHVLDQLIQHAPDPEAAITGLARFERYSCTASVAGEIVRRSMEADICGVVSSVSVPTLVLHAIADPGVSFSHGQYFADHIPGARLVPMDLDSHVSWNPADHRVAVDAIREFVANDTSRAPVTTDRILSTVLFTDIADSTVKAADMGDARWRKLLDGHDNLAQEEVAIHGGILVKSTGDGIMARFDGPSRAVACAHALRRRASGLGLGIRSGVHTGEIELRGDDIGGIAVHIASRVARMAAPGEVLVSRTVRDLSVGSGVTFHDRGTHNLKGVPDDWQIFATSV